MGGVSTFTGMIYKNWMETFQLKKMEGIIDKIKFEDKILDVGYGAGFLESLVHNVFALDTQIHQLENPTAINVCGSGNCLPFKTDTFKTVFCIDVIHLLNGIRELLRVLDEDGILILTSFCNSYNKLDKLKELLEYTKEIQVIDTFFVGVKELDAVIVCTHK